MSERICAWSSLWRVFLCSTKLAQRRSSRARYATWRRLIGTFGKVTRRLIGTFGIIVGLVPQRLKYMFSVHSKVAITVSPNGRGTSSHWALPLTDLQPKKGIRTSRALKSGCEKSPQWNRFWFRPEHTGEPCEFHHWWKSKVHKYWAPDLRCNG